METSFGIWIKRRRKALDLTQDELAQRVGCSTSAIVKIEADQRRPSRQIAELLAKHLEVPPNQHALFIKVARQEKGFQSLSTIPTLPQFETPGNTTPPANNLPLYPTLFIGRKYEIDIVSSLLLDPACRLLTLTGPGGVGKTRLAVEVARKLETQFRDGVFFLSMAPVDLPESIIPALANGLGLITSVSADPNQQVFNHLQDKNILLILDNMEHLVASSSILAEILDHTTFVKLLLTSREQVYLQWEWIFEVQGLQVPEEVAPIDLNAYSAAALFLHRARQVSRYFQITKEETAALVQICKTVDGLPLAIELAASWVRVMSIYEIAHELERSMDLLETSLRDIPERHRSIKMVFDHSWRLLTSDERLTLMKLSVFSGGFSRQAAESVAGVNLIMLSSIVNKSLIRYNNREERYYLHELIRQYAYEQFRLQKTQPDLINELHRQAAEWFEQANLLAEAVQHALASKDFTLAGRLIEKIAPLTIVSGQIQTALSWLNGLPNDRMLNSPNLCLIHSAGLMFTNQLEASEERLQDCERSLNLHHSVKTSDQSIMQGRLAIMRANLARIYGSMEECISHTKRALELLPESESYWRASPMVHSASAYLLDGNVGPSPEEQAVATLLAARDSGNLFTLLRSITNLARLRATQGQLHQAAKTYRLILDEVPGGLQSLAGSAAYYFGLAYFTGLGYLLYEWNDLENAEQHLIQGIDLVRGNLTADADLIIFGYANMGRLRQARGDDAGALAAMEELNQQARQRKFLPGLVARQNAIDASIRLAQGDKRAALLWAESSGLSLKDQDLPFPRETEYLALARVAIASSKENPQDYFQEDVISMLDRLLFAAETGNRIGSVIEILCLRALIYDVLEDFGAARSAIFRALRLAEPGGFTRTFLDKGEEMYRLLRETMDSIAPGQPGEYPLDKITRVLAAFDV
jgi:predicted ATPase/transcriptional regulator with XRE-family HTH domain